MKLKAGSKTIESKNLEKLGLDKCLLFPPQLIRWRDRLNTESSIERLKKYGSCYVSKGRDTVKIEVI